ncbi:LiaF-related protein [Peribacillus frigoritolerans]|nr:LiaF-related protein [Peribacillus frigoritolerans]
MFGHQQTTEHVYEWNSVNVQGGVGDTVIDLSKTILPKRRCCHFHQEYHWQYHCSCTVWHRHQGPSFCHCRQSADF